MSFEMISNTGMVGKADEFWEKSWIYSVMLAFIWKKPKFSAQQVWIFFCKVPGDSVFITSSGGACSAHTWF